MSQIQYIKCPYCSKTVSYNENHLNICIPNYVDGILLNCYSCGKQNKKYSNSQLTKEDKARCIDCVSNDIKTKFMPYRHLYINEYHREHYDVNNTIDKQLEFAVGELNLPKVNELLEIGANPNYNRQDTFQPINKFIRLLSYNADGSEKPENDDIQPSTPLKLCVFRFSDCDLTCSQRSTLIKIAEQLIKYGASAIEAKEYYECRYGTPDIDNGEEIEEIEEIAEVENNNSDVERNKKWNEFYKLLCNKK